MTTNRAYSVLDVKATEVDGKRILRGIASTPATDRMGDVVDPKGAQFKLPIPLLWQHDSNQPIGNITKATVTSKGIQIEAEIATIEEDGTLKARIDEAYQTIRAGLVRGLSIGFRGLEVEPIKGTYGLLFKAWEWLELSAVTVPANAQATIQSVKSYDTHKAASGASTVRLNLPGATGPVKSKPIPKPQEGEMNISEKIKACQTERETKAARLNELALGDEGQTMDAAQREEFDTLRDEIKQIDDETKRLRDLEVINKAAAVPVDGGQNSEGASQNRGGNIQFKAQEKLEPGIEFARYAMCRIGAKGNAEMAFRLAERHYPGNDRVVNTLKAQAMGADLSMIMKATVEAGTTLDATWAAPLVDYQNFAGDFVEFLRPQTIIGQFGTNGRPSLNRIPFNVRIAGQTSGGAAQWVGEGAPKPLTAFDFTATELRWAKVAAISVLTNELIRFSSPSAERLVRDALAAAVIERIDLDFVDPSKAAVTNVSPASITNGATSVASSGNTQEDIDADIQALWAPFIAARNAPRNAVYIMDSTTALALSMIRNPLGQATYPGITMNGGTFLGVPVIVSDYVPSDTAGGLVILANASDIWLADDGQVTIDASQEASLQMLDNPTNNSATGTPTTMVSMFQTNSTAFRAERYINWARRRLSGVAYLTGVSWGRGA